MSNFGTAYLQIIPSLRGGVRGLEQEINRADIGGKTGREAGRRFGGALGDVMRTAGGFVLAKAALGIGQTIGNAFSLGLDRYMNIQNAEAKLGALGHSAETVSQIMDNALASVKGTAFGMGEAADTAASMVASGIAPGEQLESVLRTIANTAAIAGTDMQSMGAIFSKVAASGKVQGDVLAQLADRGVPALQWLADELGVTTEEVARMASAGEIDFETFQRAMANGMDPNAAVIMGETLSGAMDNAKAALGRFGAEIMERIGPGIERALYGIIDGLDWLTEKVGPAFDWVIEKLQPAWEAIKDFFGFGGEDTPFVQGLNSAESAANPLRIGLEKLRDGFVSFWEKAEPIVKDLAAGLKEWWDEHGPKVIVMAENLAMGLGAAMTVIGRQIEIAGKVVAWFWDLFGDDVMAEITSTLSFLAGLFEGVTSIIAGVWSVMSGLLTGDWEQVDSGLRKITEGLEIFFGAIFQRIHDMTIGRFQDMTRGMQEKVREGADGVRNRLTELRTRANEIATTIRNWVVDKFKGLADGVRDAARNAKNWFGEQFDQIKAKASTPVKFVIDTVYNDGIRALWNKVANAFDLKTLPLVSTKGFARGGWTGPGPKFMPAGLVHADEFVVQKESRKRFEDKYPGFLHHINLTGEMPEFHGYATGGRVRPVAGGHSGWNGGRYRSGGWHGGVDYPVPMGSPVFAAMAGIVQTVNRWFHSYGHHIRIGHAGGWQTLYAHLSRIGVRPGQAVGAGQQIGNVGSTGNSTGPHLHFEALSGGRQVNPDSFLAGARGAPGGMSGSAQAGLDIPFFSSVRDLFGSALGKLSEIGGTEWGRLVSGVPRGIADEVFNYAKDQLGFLDGGTVPYDGRHWLSEDNRPELVVGKQMGAMRAGTRVFNGDQTEQLFGQSARQAARDELASLLRNGVTLRDGKLWFDENMARHDRGNAQALRAYGLGV